MSLMKRAAPIIQSEPIDTASVCGQPGCGKKWSICINGQRFCTEHSHLVKNSAAQILSDQVARDRLDELYRRYPGLRRRT